MLPIFCNSPSCNIIHLPFSNHTISIASAPLPVAIHAIIDSREQGWATQSAPPVLLYYFRFPAKTFTNVGMVQQVVKNRVRAPTHHTGNKSPDTRRGSLASLAIHNPCRSRFIAFKRLAYIAPRSTFSGFKSL